MSDVYESTDATQQVEQKKLNRKIIVVGWLFALLIWIAAGPFLWGYYNSWDTVEEQRQGVVKFVPIYVAVFGLFLFVAAPLQVRWAWRIRHLRAGTKTHTMRWSERMMIVIWIVLCLGFVAFTAYLVNLQRSL